ncbi:MAG: CDP-alcohol phosphatidyltransferase family protein [Bacteroidota bacterium]
MPVAPPPPQASAPEAAAPEAALKPLAKRRINDILLGRFERWALPKMAQALPPWIGPDTLTGIALAGALVSAVAYALAGDNLAWLHLASLGLVVHWWGDSLDGTLARVRQIRRERYGLYVDHQCDAISAAALVIGMGAGDLMRLDLALAIGLGVVLLMNLVHMVTIARDVFKISFGGFGPTELRLVAIAVNTAVWALGPTTVSLWGLEWTPFDLIGLVAAPVLLAFYLVASVRETVLIAKLDPRPEPGQDGLAYDPTGQLHGTDTGSGDGQG